MSPFMSLSCFIYFFLYFCFKSQKRISLLHCSCCHLWDSLSPGSTEWRQAEKPWLEFFHAPEPQRGLPGEGGIHVVVRNHHHLHPRRQRRPDAVGSVFKHQTLSKDRGEENKVILSPKPIRSTGFQPCGRRSAVSGKTNPEEQESAETFPFTCDELNISSE